MKQISKGWVILFEPLEHIMLRSLESSRKRCIERHIKSIDPNEHLTYSWKKAKKQGYKCVKATMTIELIN